MKNIIRNIPNIIFNCSEVAIIFLFGSLLKLQIETMILIFIVFAMIRCSLGGALHYKDWYRCMIWSALVFLSLFVVAKADFMLCMIMTIFCAVILTKEGNINNLFMWKNKTKYEDVENYIKENATNSKLISFENNLREKDKLSYIIYEYRFIQHKTFKEISELLQMENPRIVEKLDAIVLAIRLFCEI